jgi:hypothetical protein
MEILSKEGMDTGMFSMEWGSCSVRREFWEVLEVLL